MIGWITFSIYVIFTCHYDLIVFNEYGTKGLITFLCCLSGVTIHPRAIDGGLH